MGLFQFIRDGILIGFMLNIVNKLEKFELNEQGLPPIELKFTHGETGQQYSAYGYYVITQDGKEVFRAERVGNFDGGSDLKCLRFNYGSWVGRVYRYYRAELRKEYAEERIRRKALFSPLDED